MARIVLHWYDYKARGILPRPARPYDWSRDQQAPPALIIQNDVGNQYSPLTIVAPITSQGLRKVYPTEVLMASKESGLSKDSKVLLSQIRTIDKSRLIKKMGTLS